MKRAQYKDELYFDEYIFSQEERIEKFKKVLESLNKTDEDKIKQCKNYLSGFYLDLINAKYSLGLQKDVINIDVNELFNYVCEVDSYNDMVNYLSLAIIFDINQKKIKNIMQCDKYDDKLIYELKRHVFRENNQYEKTPLKYPDHYKIFCDFIDNKIMKSEFIEFMDNQWYDTCKECSFYDSHKNDKRTYTGYWCWLAAAIIKMKSIKDISGIYIPTEVI
jgi:hypothetical protein